MINQYYTEISEQEFGNGPVEIKFDESDINQLTNIYKDVNLKHKDEIIILFDKDPLYIYKLPDEWFLVKYKELNNGKSFEDLSKIHHVHLLRIQTHKSTKRDTFFKCDQFQGLIKCINDIKENYEKNN